MERIPANVLQYILNERLSVGDKVRLRGVCKRWLQAICFNDRYIDIESLNIDMKSIMLRKSGLAVSEYPVYKEALEQFFRRFRIGSEVKMVNFGTPSVGWVKNDVLELIAEYCPNLVSFVCLRGPVSIAKLLLMTNLRCLKIENMFFEHSRELNAVGGQLQHLFSANGPLKFMELHTSRSWFVDVGFECLNTLVLHIDGNGLLGPSPYTGLAIPSRNPRLRRLTFVNGDFVLSLGSDENLPKMSGLKHLELIQMSRTGNLWFLAPFQGLETFVIEHCSDFRLDDFEGIPDTCPLCITNQPLLEVSHDRFVLSRRN